MAKRRNLGGFSWKRATGVTRMKSRVSRATGIPLTKSGRQRKVGKMVTGGGCLLPVILILSIVMLMTVLLSGCAAPAAAPTPPPSATIAAATPTASPIPTPAPTVASLVNVNVPAVVFEGEDMDAIVQGGLNKGFSAVTPNEDGSVTYTMTQERYDQYKNECKANIIESLDKLPAEYSSIQKIEYNDNFTEITITATKDDWNLKQSMSIFVAGTAAQFYFMLTGQDLTVTVTAIDASSGEILNTGTYPSEE